MSPESIKRKLTAILSADVKGYSRLMGENEVATIRTLEQYREVIRDFIEKRQGRVVDSPGDNLLAEFASVVDAVESAVEIQKELKARNSVLPENRRMEFRIGINLGDVVEEKDRIYGDGVNIAARIEGLAEGGGICVSGSAFEQVKSKLKVGYEYLGEQSVKNIAEKLRVYRVIMEPEAEGSVIYRHRRDDPRHKRSTTIIATLILVAGLVAIGIWNFYFRAPKIEPASKDKMAFPLPDKPSIAVLPFVNMSDDKSQEYLADGITENIISALSQVPNLLVIARNSTFTYKGKPVKVQQVAEDLGVRYVLEGSVQKSGDTLRITAQLIDAITGQHVWSERYNRELKNIFVLQDDITMKLITALQVKLTVGEGARLLSKGTKNLEAYLKYLQASAVFNIQTKEGYAQARRLWEEVIALDPQYAAAYGGLGAFHAMEAVQGFSKSPGESLKLALELTKKAIAIDESDAVSHSRLGWLYVLVGRQYDKAIAECERAIDLAPNSAECHIWMAFVLTMAGRSEEAVRYAEQALRLNPYPPSWWIRQLGQSYFFAGRYEEAIAAHKKSLNISPNDLLTHIALTTACSSAGRHEEARAQAAEILRINPKFSVEGRANFVPCKNQADLDRFLDGLRKAGLK
jgi:adenylate cyclase